MKFIKLTEFANPGMPKKDIRINIDHIVHYYQYEGDRANIALISGFTINVNETMEEIEEAIKNA